jgi:hypothetical protein
MKKQGGHPHHSHHLNNGYTKSSIIIGENDLEEEDDYCKFENEVLVNLFK